MNDPAAMQKQIDDLEYENGKLRAALAEENVQMPALLGLTHGEATVFRVLLKRLFATRETILLVLHGAATARDPKIVDVYICHIRKKLKPLGIVINPVRGIGYEIDKQWRDKFMEAAEVAP